MLTEMIWQMKWLHALNYFTVLILTVHPEKASYDYNLNNLSWWLSLIIYIKQINVYWIEQSKFIRVEEKSTNYLWSRMLWLENKKSKHFCSNNKLSITVYNCFYVWRFICSNASRNMYHIQDPGHRPWLNLASTTLNKSVYLFDFNLLDKTTQSLVPPLLVRSSLSI